LPGGLARGLRRRGGPVCRTSLFLNSRGPAAIDVRIDVFFPFAFREIGAEKFFTDVRRALGLFL